MGWKWGGVDIKTITRGKDRKKGLVGHHPSTAEPPAGPTLEGLHLEQALLKRAQERLSVSLVAMV